MYWKLEPSGIMEKINRNGDLCIQIRYSFFLEKYEKGYQERLHEILKIKPEAENKQELQDSGFEKTGKFELQPLHTHFIQLPFNVTDDLIEIVGNQLLKIVSNYYKKGYFERGERFHIPNTIPRYDTPNDEKINLARIRVSQIKNTEKWQQLQLDKK